MNAYVSENHIVVGQQRLKDKENEIVAIPQLLENWISKVPQSR